MVENKIYQLDILRTITEELALLQNKSLAEKSNQNDKKDGSEEEPNIPLLLSEIGTHIKSCYKIIGEVQEGKEIMEILEDIEIVLHELRKVI